MTAVRITTEEFPQLVDFLAARHERGQDLYDEWWGGEYRTVTGPTPEHGRLVNKLVRLLDPLAEGRGLYTSAPLNIGIDKHDCRVPDLGVYEPDTPRSSGADLQQRRSRFRRHRNADHERRCFARCHPFSGVTGRRSIGGRRVDAFRGMAVLMRPGIPEIWWDAFEPPPGYRAEIIQSEIVLSPSPSRRHVNLQMDLAVGLQSAVPAGFETIFGLEWKLTAGGIVAQAPQPDLIVGPRSDEPVVDPPLLAVEILSSTDLHRLENQAMTRIEGKRLDYAANGLEHYLEIEPEPPFVRVRRYELRAGQLHVVAEFGGAYVVRADVPFDYELNLAELLS